MTGLTIFSPRESVVLILTLGYGKAQDTLTLPLNILLFTEGCESVAIGLLLPELEKQWNITAFQKSFLITAVYVGVSLGSYMQSYSDNVGRSVFIKWNAILQLLFGVLSCIATSMNAFIAFRFVYGVGIGIVLPLSATYMSECTPAENRAIILTKSRTYWSSGCLVTCVLAWGFLYTHRWRTLLLVICIPGVYALWQHMRAGKQSLRYLWVHKRTDEVVELLDYMAELNERKKIPRQQIEYMIEQKEESIQEGTFSDLINDKYRKMTIILAVAWFSVCFVYYGLLLLLPTILSRNATSSYNFNYITLIVLSVVEMFCFYFSRTVMDHPDIGRKKSTYIGFAIVAACCIFLILISEQHSYLLLVFFLVIKIFITTTFMTLYPYSAEIYTTLIRGKAMGIFSLAGRIATAALGFLGVNALYWFDGNGLYVIILVLCSLSSVLVTKMPYCTLGRPLDA